MVGGRADPIRSNVCIMDIFVKGEARQKKSLAAPTAPAAPAAPAAGAAAVDPAAPAAAAAAALAPATATVRPIEGMALFY